MKENEKLLKVNLVFDSVLNSIETGDHRIISESFKELNRIETDFLDEYSNRKKEGAYYTRDSVSDFIVSQVIMIFFSKYLKINQISSLNDIYKMNGDLKFKIVQKLLDFSILDPACGSGVFLLSAANVVYNLLHNLEPELEITDIKWYILKNLFGSEINDYARKLCIMKLFRW